MDTTRTARHLPQAAPPSASGLLSALLPSAAFLAANHVAGLAAGMIVASVASAALVLLRRRRGVGLGVVLPASLGYVIVRAIAGVVTDSEQVFFGVGLALSAMTALGIAATAWTARPAAAFVLPTVVRYRERTVTHPLHRRVAAQVTVAWAAGELALTAWEALHLTHATAAEFVLTRTFLGWPVMGVWIFLLIFYVRFRLDPLDHRLGRHAVA